MEIWEYPWSDYDAIQRESTEIQKDIAKALELIHDAKARYLKAKFRARSKKDAEDMKTLFAELDDYRSETDIQDAFGWGLITEKEMDRLIELWRAREKAQKNGGKYKDRVSEMLDVTARRIGDEYREKIELAREMKRIRAERAKEIAREDSAYRAELYRRGLEQEENV